MIKMDKLIDSISKFLRERFDIMKGDIVDKISSIIAKLISFFILFLILLFVIGFASITIGSYLNTILENSYLGYGIISLFYLVVFSALYLYYKSGKLKKIIESEFNKGLKN